MLTKTTSTGNPVLLFIVILIGIHGILDLPLFSPTQLLGLSGVIVLSALLYQSLKQNWQALWDSK